MLFYFLTINNMGTGWLFDSVNDLFSGALTWVGTLLTGWVGSIIIFILAVGLVYVVYRVVKSFTKW
jgi:uncharacterized membrane protein